MPRLSWSGANDRVYEVGVDQGVLYVGSDPGVPWVGLIAINEKSSGGTAKGHYQDGVKYLNVPPREEYQATINAYTAPPEFSACDGTGVAGGGMFVLQQPRREFGLSYRTMIGNALDGPDHGYKLHFIYNALTEPTQRDYNTLGAQVEPGVIAWDITTTPVRFGTNRPTAHYMVDSRYADPARLAVLEDVMYGTASEPARMPDPAEIYVILNGAMGDDIIIIDNGDGTWTAIGADEYVQDNGDGTFVISHWRAELLNLQNFRLTVT
jgi:hypothetical protein